MHCSLWFCAATLAALALTACSAEACGPGAEKPAIDLRGALSGMRQAAQMVVRDREAFETLWRKHGRAGDTSGAPSVDFAKNHVVCVFLGSKSTGGWSVRIDGADERANVATVRVTVEKPGKRTIVTQAFTSPYAMLSVARMPKVVKFVVTEKER